MTPSGVCPGSIASDCAKHLLLLLLGNDVVENAEDIGLLAEYLPIGIVGKQAARGHPALAGDAGTDVIRSEPGSAGKHRVAEVLLKVGSVDEGTEVLERGHARFVIGVVGGDFAFRLNPIDEAPPWQLAKQAVWCARISRTM